MIFTSHTPLRISLFALLALPGISCAADLHVPSFYPTIQDAIDAASSGDVVQIEPGTYYENININGKNIVIRPFNNNFSPVINGQQEGPVITFSGNEPASCIVRGLTLINGKAANGAGIKANYTLATIRNCTITGNIATGSGGGVHGVSGLMEKCTITFNEAANGAGISDVDGIVDSCVIKNNKASATGGGAYNIDGVLRFSEISKNEASTKGGGVNQVAGELIANLIASNKITASGPLANPNGFGGGVCDAGGTVSLNLIMENTSNGDGGGIANSDGIIQNNVIADNSARRGGGTVSCTGNFENNTIWGNTASHQAGGCLNMGTSVTNTIIYSNTAPADPQWSGANIPTYSCIQNWTGGQPDIITADPQLQDPGKGKFYLKATSPCVDAGQLVPGLVMDFEGEPRPFDGTPTPAGDGSDYDIGADEYMPANIDLVASVIDIKVKYKGIVPKQKTMITGKFAVANTGSDPTDGPSTIQFYLSNDAVYDPGDTPVGKIIKLKKLKGGKTKKANCKVKLLNQTVTGQYLIAVADIGNTVTETNENNNEIAYGPLP